MPVNERRLIPFKLSQSQLKTVIIPGTVYRFSENSLLVFKKNSIVRFTNLGLLYEKLDLMSEALVSYPPMDFGLN